MGFILEQSNPPSGDLLPISLYLRLESCKNFPHSHLLGDWCAASVVFVPQLYCCGFVGTVTLLCLENTIT